MKTIPIKYPKTKRFFFVWKQRLQDVQILNLPQTLLYSDYHYQGM